MAIETKDLWASAYVLSEGGWLEGVKVERREDGRREIVFRFRGQGVEDMVAAFRSGQARCNVTRLKASLYHLKEVMYGEKGDTLVWSK
jgi:hypothetical protein